MSTNDSDSPTITYPLVPAHVAAPRPLPSPPPRHLGVVRLAIATAALLLAAAMILKAFIGDTFVIPTVSMEPTIVGHPERGDRVLLSRLPYLVGDPRRWDIVLFRYPNNRAIRYLKRVVGLGGEQLMIRGGDLYIADARFPGTVAEGLRNGRVAILRKPREVLEGLLRGLPVLSDTESASFGPESFHRLFAVPQDERSYWKLEGSLVTLDSPRQCLAETRRAARDRVEDPLSAAGSLATVSAGRHPVGDLSFRISVRAAAGSVTLAIRDTTHPRSIQAVVPVEGTPAETRILLGGRVVGRHPLRLRPDAWTELRLDNVDDRIRLLADGQVLLERDYTHPPVEDEAVLAASRGRGTASFGGTGGPISFREPRLHRDVYYVRDGITRFLIPEGSYVCLGDNSPASADSRSWRRTAVEIVATGEILYGDADGITPGHMLGPGENPWEEPDGSWCFVDVLGNRHVFDSSVALRVLGTWSTPYVARDLITGRGVAVIHPLRRARLLR